MSNSIDPREIMKLVSNAINGAEKRMNELGLCVPAEHQPLSWRKEGKRMRICMGDRPLIEHPFHVRAEVFELLPDLIEAAKKAMREKIGKVDLKKLEAVQDAIMDA